MKKVMRLLPGLVALGLAAGSLNAQSTTGAQGTELKVGDAAPDFTLQATDGKTYSFSKDLRGRWVVLGWFPKAFTAG
jgi:peroxiredoxin